MPPGHGDRARLWWLFALDCVLATVVRLVLAWRTGGYPTDVLTFASWAGILRSQPLDHFYSTAQQPDHLPGDLWILKLLVSAYGACGGRDVGGPVFAFLTQVVPTLGDLLAALMIALIALELAGPERAGRYARWYLLNPATIIIAGVWGQWDSISLALLLTGLWLSLRVRLWIVSSPFLTWAVLVKPQLALGVVCIVALLAHRLFVAGPRGSGRSRLADVARLGAWCALGLATGYALLAPFGIHLLSAPPGGVTLLGRLRVALGLYPYTTLGATNLWMLPIGSLRRVRDDVPGWWGLTPQEWGEAMVAVTLLVIAATCLLRRRRSEPMATALWAATASMLAVFLLSTRVHERYALPVLGLALVWGAACAPQRGFSVLFWALSACLTLDVVLVLYGGLSGPQGRIVTFGSAWWLGVSGLYCLLGLALLSWPWLGRPRRRDRVRPARAALGRSSAPQ